MLPHHIELALFQPEIPQNTGNIARLAAVTQCRLHLIRPFGFKLSDRLLRRAGLDYWPFVDLEIHNDLESLLEQQPKCALLSKFGSLPFTAIPSDCRLLIFGSETKGLPNQVKSKLGTSLYFIPMYHKEVRSLNLANAVAIVLYSHLLKVRESYGLPSYS